MSTLGEILAATKKALLVTEDLQRLARDCEALTRKVVDHEHRLIRIETMIEMGGKRPRRSLPSE
jgi:hypothetical protein